MISVLLYYLGGRLILQQAFVVLFAVNTIFSYLKNISAKIPFCLALLTCSMLSLYLLAFLFLIALLKSVCKINRDR